MKEREKIYIKCIKPENKMYFKVCIQIVHPHSLRRRQGYASSSLQGLTSSCNIFSYIYIYIYIL